MTALRLVPPPARPATPPPVDPELIREQLERLAYWSLNGHVRDIELRRLLAALSPLPKPDAMQWFVELEEAVGLLNFSHWSEVVPEATGTARDEQADDAVRTHVDLALDALLGGCPMISNLLQFGRVLTGRVYAPVICDLLGHRRTWLTHREALTLTAHGRLLCPCGGSLFSLNSSRGAAR